MKLRVTSVLSLLYISFQCVTSSDKILFPDDENLPGVLKVNDMDVHTRQFFFNRRQSTCEQITGEPGDCKPYGQCPQLLKFVSENGLQNQETVQYLRSRICSFFRNSVNLCCPIATASGTSNTVAPVSLTGTFSLPTTAQCGFRFGGKIVKGKEIQPGDHPWLVGIGAPGQNGQFRVLCGGTLISSRHIITAAHCYVRRPGFPEITHAILGEHSLSRSTENVVILRITKHTSPGYNDVSQVNDIELLTLESDVRFNSVIRPACLPSGDFRGRNLDGTKVTIVGWGDTMFRSFKGSDVPLAADIVIVPKSECRTKYASTPEIPLDEKQICAAFDGADACQGDSGGPLIYQDPNQQSRYFLIGVVSFGIECANPNFPGVYTYIPEYFNWIKQNL